MKTLNFFTAVSLLLLLTSCSSSKYVNYLENHTEVIKMTDSLQFNSLDDSFYNKNLFLVGEVHEVQTSPRIDFAMFTQLNQKMHVDTYSNKMVSLNTLYIDSRLTVDSKALPKFMQDKGKAFTKFKYS
ncbi:hypothetical protein BXQ17_11175 [Polaribacter sp. BM10]|uniref:hypothetical protein n=1 Tax=Polaribacter sp. BM10 TaxID=1529069 RepID=UPI00098B9870|nr:hypothetical protein [Polaribacter sp. BM10]AQS94596.1 hypothetical protein BXQ17_11175 [Polaribacter sp. BM10]